MAGCGDAVSKPTNGQTKVRSRFPGKTSQDRDRCKVDRRTVPPGLVVDKLVLDYGGVNKSNFGPPETCIAEAARKTN